MSASARLGAWIADGQTHFRVWAPRATTVEAVVDSGSNRLIVPLDRDPVGFFAGSVDRVLAGDRYQYRIDGGPTFPDPAARFQPEGVHGPSEIIDPARFRWTDAAWSGPDRDRMVIYELHVGSFTRQGTYAGVAEHLADLKDLGVTLIELLPLNDFAGRWGWGYDGAALFAPARCYGTPDELRSLIDQAHALGLGVILDVVYNHFGPAGNYTAQFSDQYTQPDIGTAWGPAINLGGPGSEHVRGFFIANARHWIEDYHFDGFRVDATHAFVDDGPQPFLAEFAAAVRATTNRRLVLIAEDHRNLNTIIKPSDQGGWDFDGVWADDFHHNFRRYLTGDHDGVYQDFGGSVAEIVQAIDQGWLKQGEYSNYRQKHRGTDPQGIPPERFVFCLQNHDRVGNRGKGDRLHHAIDRPTYHAASAILLLAQETPMLFMGQEWAASTPFFYFTDHAPELGQAIRDGRAREFQLYDDFNTPEKLATIPDPQAESTFRTGQLDWTERDHEPHAATLRWYRALLRFRHTAPGWHDRVVGPVQRTEHGIEFTLGGGKTALVNLCGAATFALTLPESMTPVILLSSESSEFADLPQPIVLEPLRSAESGLMKVWHVHFERPGAVILETGKRHDASQFLP